MEEKEQLRRQIRLLQGLIDDYKNLHGDAPAPGTSAPARWQPPTCSGIRAFGARYPRPGRRAFPPSRGPEWRKKYSLVNRPPGSAEPPLRPSGGSPGPDPQQRVLERQVQLSPDQNMVIRIKPTSKPGSASGAGVPRGFPEGDREPPRTDHRPQEGEGEPPAGQRQPSRPAHARGSGGAEDPVPVWRKEPGRPRAVRAAGSAGSTGSAGDGPPAPRRTVSESALALQARSPPASPCPRGGPALGRKGAPLSAGGAVPPAPGDGRAGCPAPLASSGPGAAPARPAPGPRQAREAARLGLCRASRFRRSNYKWVAASARGPRAARRASSPRAAAEGASRTPVGTAEPAEKPQPGRSVHPAAPPAPPAPGAAPSSKYRWKAAGPCAASFRWPADAGSRDRASQLAPVPPGCPPGARPAAVPGGSKPAAGETSASAYKVRSRTKIVRRRGGASGPADKKSSPPPAAAAARSQFSLRRPGRSGSAPRKTPQKALLPGARHRPYCPPPGRAAPPSREAPSPLAPRTPPAGKVIKTRYRIVKKTPAAPPPGPPATPSWRARRPPLSRSLVLSRPRPTAGAARALPGPPGPPSWRGRGYRCISGVLYRVSANKLSKTGGRPLPRAGRVEPGGSCSRALASRAVQRSLAIVRQARQRRRRREAEYCMYYNRFGRCHRGARCPYIHDPEKVAVCTRFVRGTCKKTDGTCPFSHHVSKEKMPVCSYFLRGVCSNSDCPYSHVYVSRKAAVCTDFLKGYCPLGAKCKKKHTLRCPDFSRRGACPRGARCQLLHRGQTRPCRRAAPAPEPSSTPPRSGASAGRAARKSSAAQRPAGRPSPPAPARSASSAPRDLGAPQEAPPGPPKASGPPSPSSSAGSSSGSSPAASPAPPASPALRRRDPRDEAAPGPARLPRLPSFISLRCTPSPGAPPPARRPRSPARQNSGPPLHIKPRL